MELSWEIGRRLLSACNASHLIVGRREFDKVQTSVTETAARRRLYFANAYGYAGAVAQLLRSPEGRSDLVQWIDRNSPTFRSALRKPGKRSILHDLLHALAYSDWEHQTHHWDLNSLEQFFRDHGERIPRDLKKKTDGNYDTLLTRLEKPLAKLADSAFHILFADRSTLLAFNELLANVIRSLSVAQFPELRAQGLLRRPAYIPTWLKRAVFHRDKGRCQVCHRDLTGVINPISNAQLDHIWPLARSGSNDATNFQLLCSRCNARKYASTGTTSEEYYVYW